MVLSLSMKKLLFAAVRFLLRSVLLVAAAYGFLLLRHIAGMEISFEQGLAAAQVAVIHDLFILSIPLIALSAVISLFHILHLEKLRFIARLFLMLTATLVLVGIFWGWQEFREFHGPEISDRFTFAPHMVYSSDQLFVLTGSIQNTRVEEIWYRSTSAGQSIVYGQAPRLVQGNRVLEVDETGARIQLASLNGSLESLYENNVFKEENRFFIEARSVMGRYLEYASSSLLHMLVNALSLSVSLLSLWFWVRLTRWPLWNAMWALLICGFMYFGLVLIQAPSSQALLLQIHPLIHEYALPVFLTVLALIWSLLSLLLPPFKDWKKELGV